MSKAGRVRCAVGLGCGLDQASGISTHRKNAGSWESW